MAQKKQSTKSLREKLKKKPPYMEAIKLVEKFLENQEKAKKKESIKISPYAEDPWEAFPELFSSRWSGLK